MTSIGSAATVRFNEDFIRSLVEAAGDLEIIDEDAALRAQMRSGSFTTHDAAAADHGLQPAPHQVVLARAAHLGTAGGICGDLAVLCERAASHVDRFESMSMRGMHVGEGSVFIGHGPSRQWRELKDFIQDCLHLPVDEFNRVPTAGYGTVQRLSEMLDNAAIAFLVLTAEDEMADGTHQARPNVIHEAGLFQGRLGFPRAIILLEEGCDEFSNIHGLGQLRYPRGNRNCGASPVLRALLKLTVLRGLGSRRTVLAPASGGGKGDE